MKQAVLFLSNKSSQWVIDHFESISLVDKSSYDVFFLYHEQNHSIPDAIESLNYCTFTSDILHELGYSPLAESLVPGSTHFPLLKFYLQNTQYDYYWLIEDDVLFTGNWEELFNSYKDETTDFITTHVKRYEEVPQWHWWSTLNTGKEKVPDINRICSFNPICRLSNRALKAIDEALKNGWSGHYEVTTASVLLNGGYSIDDMGGDGSFVKSANKNRFYTAGSMSYLPLELGSRPNTLYHPVKEKKIIDLDKLNKNCVISAVGKNSLHREWIKGSPDFDLHLIVYDDSYSKFCNDTNFICYQKGYKFKLVYNYLQDHPEYLKRYDYFFIPDDDILMDSNKISALFLFMEEFHLQIAQPALLDSYYTYEHTVRDSFCLLRYTNFVEMMLPCFAREALSKVLASFNENNSGWGIEYHWPLLIDSAGKDMAIIDKIHVVHTRPIQSYNPENRNDLNTYIEKYNLKREILELGYVAKDSSESIITERTTYKHLYRFINCIADHFVSTPSPNSIGIEGLTGISLFLTLYSRISKKKGFFEVAFSMTERITNSLLEIIDNMDFSNGLPGFTWYIEYLAQHNYIVNNTHKTLEDIYVHINKYQFEEGVDFDINQIIGVARHYVIRMANPLFDINDQFNQIEKEKLIKVIYEIHEWSEDSIVSEKKINSRNIVDCILLVCQAKKVLSLPELDLTLSRMVELLDHLPLGDNLSYLLKSYAMLLASKDLNDKPLWDKVIEDVANYKVENKETDSQQLQNLYLLHRIYQLTHEEIFKSQALEILRHFIDEYNKGKSFLNNDQPRTDNLIHSGLILTSLLFDKDPELDNCIL